MSNFIRDEVKIVGLQTFDRYEKLNPVEISIKTAKSTPSSLDFRATNIA